MSRRICSFIILSLILFLLIPARAQASAKADQLVKQADSYYGQTYYAKAYEAYQSARELYLKEGKNAEAEYCWEQMSKAGLTLSSFSLSPAEVKKLIAKRYPFMDSAAVKDWLENNPGETLTVDGKPAYWLQTADNIIYRVPGAVRQTPEVAKHAQKFIKTYLDFAVNPPGPFFALNPWNPYLKPVTYTVKAVFNASRKELPAKGELRLWFPVPVQTDSQRNVKLIAVSPQEYLRTAPQTDADIGALYFSLPLEELKSDLKITVIFSFEHYERNFVIDPAQVGSYDRSTPLYKLYTVSERNIAVTPEITAQAQAIVGEERNPYLQARKIYDYLMDNVYYSFMPHLYLEQTRQPESLWVHKYRYGDCGAQSIYFSALCRSLGIPARAIGGMLLTPGAPSDHFWAEFYLPNYGWLPVDTSLAQSVILFGNLTPAQNQAVRDYYFGNMDSCRYVIQKNVDIMPQPLPKKQLLFTMTLQLPFIDGDNLGLEQVSRLMEKAYTIELLPGY